MKDFFTIAILTLLSTASFLFTVEMESVLNWFQNNMLLYLGWILNFGVFSSFIVGLWFVLHPKLKNKVPIAGKVEYSNFSWYAMASSAVVSSSLFSIGMVDSLLNFETGLFTESESVARTMWNWACGYVTYAVAAICLAYNIKRGYGGFVATDNKMVSDMTHVFMGCGAIIAMISSLLITSGGVSSGINHVFGVAVEPSWLIILFSSIGLMSALSGIKRGIKWLSNVAIVLGLMIVTIAGYGAGWFGTLSLTMDGFFTMVASIPRFGTETPIGASDDMVNYMLWYPFFFAAWAFAYLPASAVFFMKISRGRTIREMVIGAGVIPGLFICGFYGFMGAVGLESGIRDVFVILGQLMNGWVFVVIGGVLLVAMSLWTITCIDSSTLSIGAILGSKHFVHWIVIATVLCIGFLNFPSAWDALKVTMSLFGLPIAIIYAYMLKDTLNFLLRK